MKTIATSLLAVLALGLASCQSTSSQVSTTSTSAAPVDALRSGHWTRVSNDPPTYFPKGTPADHATTFRDGYWVRRGDRAGTRFFIPANSAAYPQQILIAEAQAAMTPAAKKALQQSENEAAHHDAVSGLARAGVGILEVVGAIAAGMPASGYSPEIDNKKLKKKRRKARNE